MPNNKEENLGEDVLRIADTEGVSQRAAARAAIIDSRNRRRRPHVPQDEWEE